MKKRIKNITKGIVHSYIWYFGTMMPLCAEMDVRTIRRRWRLTKQVLGQKISLWSAIEEDLEENIKEASSVWEKFDNEQLHKAADYLAKGIK